MNAGRVVIGVGCAYEIVALTSAPVPTITELIKHLGAHPLGRVAVWAWCGYTAWHFLEPSQVAGA